jgi:hypothetical protein
MVDIDRTNFEEHYEPMVNAIRNADFIGINVKQNKKYQKCVRQMAVPHSPRSGFAGPQNYFGCFVERGRCTQHAKIPSRSSLTSDT